MSKLSNLSRALVAYLSVTVSTVSALASWEEGSELPDLSGYSLEGELPDFEGKVTYVDFWASWCLPCRASFPEMETLYQERKSEGFQILAVSVDATEKAMRRFLDRNEASFDIVWDKEQKLVADAEIEVMPTSFLIGRDGKIRRVHAGWSGAKDAAALREAVDALLKEEMDR